MNSQVRRKNTEKVQKSGYLYMKDSKKLFFAWVEKFLELKDGSIIIEPGNQVFFFLNLFYICYRYIRRF